MRVYKLHITDPVEGSCGFLWRRNLKDAREARRHLIRNEGHSLRDIDIAAIEFTPDKEGILWLLNNHASHPDNG